MQAHHTVFEGDVVQIFVLVNVQIEDIVVDSHLAPARSEEKTHRSVCCYKMQYINMRGQILSTITTQLYIYFSISNLSQS